MLSISSCCFDQGNLCFRRPCKHSYLIPNKACSTHVRTNMPVYSCTDKKGGTHESCGACWDIKCWIVIMPYLKILSYIIHKSHRITIAVFVDFSREFCISFRWKNCMMLNIGDAWFNNFYCSVVLFNNRFGIRIMNVSTPCNLHPNMSIYISGFPYNLIVMESLIHF